MVQPPVNRQVKGYIMIQLVKKVSTSTRQGKAILLAKAFLAGLLGKIESMSNEVFFHTADGRPGYNALKAAGALPKCYVSGRTCSNEYFTALVNGKMVPVGTSVGNLLIGILDDPRVKTDTDLSCRIAEAITSERKCSFVDAATFMGIDAKVAAAWNSSVKPKAIAAKK